MTHHQDSLIFQRQQAIAISHSCKVGSYWISEQQDRFRCSMTLFKDCFHTLLNLFQLSSFIIYAIKSCNRTPNYICSEIFVPIKLINKYLLTIVWRLFQTGLVIKQSSLNLLNNFSEKFTINFFPSRLIFTLSKFSSNLIIIEKIMQLMQNTYKRIEISRQMLKQTQN
jgi:hypothetical protein